MSLVRTIFVSPPAGSTEEPFKGNGDKIGIVASALCAVHCAVTPILLLMAPAFGKAWSNPMTHWVMAAFVIPVAAIMMVKGYEKTRRRSMVLLGVLGIGFVLAGAIVPSLENASSPSGLGEHALISGGSVPQAQGADSGCSEVCCPSVQTTETGEWKLNFPMASILTTLGGLFLVGTHVSNLCRCKSCKSGH
ncbi:MAG: MerC domain-containing protein [Verrucomicrobiota bacterium]